MTELLVQEQKYIDDCRRVHKGRKISAVEGNKIIGQVRYIEWNGDIYQNNGLNTAMLKLTPDEGFEIFVDRKNRNEGVGKDLITKLIDELQKNGYDQLIIRGATETAKGFYDKMFERLLENNKITFFSSQIEDHSCNVIDFLYYIRLPNQNKNKPSFN